MEMAARPDVPLMTSPAQFVREVRQEMAKVTWPPRNELIQMTAMVFLMSTVASLFFFAVDQVIGEGVRIVLGLGS